MTIRSLTMIAVLGAAVASASASPVLFSFHSNGSHSISGSLLTATDTTFFDAAGCTYVPTGLTYKYTKTTPGNVAATSGSGTLTVAGGSINFTISGGVIGGGTGYDALAGSIVSFSGGTGVLAGLSGGGSISNTKDVLNNSLHRTTFEAALVPEPASMVALGVGALGLIRRRRASK